ncbi:MAG: hypothetical protein H6550_14175 [Chitinophagales bacterium]|nr:hypothetical protein [Chitinophagales bacterium]
MRVLSLFVLLVLSSALYAKTPPAAKVTFEKHNLFNGNLQLEIPASLQKDREYYHYWDNCPDGGYTISFSSECNKKKGVNIQLNIHDWITDPAHLNNHYDPRKQCLHNAQLLQDTSYMIGNKRYTVMATLATPDNSIVKRGGTHTNNYNLSYYIIADGRMLEFNYYYWDKDGHDLERWKDISNHIINSIKWYSPGWVTAQR